MSTIIDVKNEFKPGAVREVLSKRFPGFRELGPRTFRVEAKLEKPDLRAIWIALGKDGHVFTRNLESHEETFHQREAKKKRRNALDEDLDDATTEAIIEANSLE